MFERDNRCRMLRHIGLCLIGVTIIFGCVSSDPEPMWMSVNEAFVMLAPGDDPMYSAIKGRFNKGENGEHTLSAIESDDGEYNDARHIDVETTDAALREVFRHCLNEDVVVTGTLTNGDRLVVMATEIDELIDIRNLKIGTCD